MGRVRMWVEVEGLRPLLRELDRMGPAVSQEVREASLDIAEELARNIRRRARTPQEEALVPSVRTRRDRVPKVVVGGARLAAVSRPRHGRKKGSRSVQRRPTAGSMVYGVEFGAGSWRFPRHRNADGYWIGQTFRGMSDWMVREYVAALDRVLRRG